MIIIKAQILENKICVWYQPSPESHTRSSALCQRRRSRSPWWVQKCLAKEEINQLIKLLSLNQGPSNSASITASVTLASPGRVSALWEGRLHPVPHKAHRCRVNWLFSTSLSKLMYWNGRSAPNTHTHTHSFVLVELHLLPHISRWSASSFSLFKITARSCARWSAGLGGGGGGNTFKKRCLGHLRGWFI